MLSYQDFSEFYRNPVIRELSANEKWTVSTNKKMPVDMRTLSNSAMLQQRLKECKGLTLNNYLAVPKTEQFLELVLKTEYGAIRGAKYTDKQSLMSLTDVLCVLPHATNYAYYLDCMTDGYVVLDVEKTCPEELKTKLLQLPYLYGEISMSGKGYHLVFPLPKEIDNYPDAKEKVVMKEENGYYEILMCHYVTFTRNMIEPASVNADPNGFINLFCDMASKQKLVSKTAFDISEQKPDIPYEEELLEELMKIQKSTNHHNLTPEKYNNDMSSYEYNMSKYAYRDILMLTDSCQNMRPWNHFDKATQTWCHHEYTDDEIMWIIAELMGNVLAPREKHQKFIKGMPYLVFTAYNMICREKKTE